MKFFPIWSVLPGILASWNRDYWQGSSVHYLNFWRRPHTWTCKLLIYVLHSQVLEAVVEDKRFSCTCLIFIIFLFLFFNFHKIIWDKGVAETNDINFADFTLLVSQMWWKTLHSLASHTNELCSVRHIKEAARCNCAF